MSQFIEFKGELINPKAVLRLNKHAHVDISGFIGGGDYTPGKGFEPAIQVHTEQGTITQVYDSEESRDKEFETLKKGVQVFSTPELVFPNLYLDVKSVRLVHHTWHGLSRLIITIKTDTPEPITILVEQNDAELMEKAKAFLRRFGMTLSMNSWATTI